MDFRRLGTGRTNGRPKVCYIRWYVKQKNDHLEGKKIKLSGTWTV